MFSILKLAFQYKQTQQVFDLPLNHMHSSHVIKNLKLKRVQK